MLQTVDPSLTRHESNNPVVETVVGGSILLGNLPTCGDATTSAVTGRGGASAAVETATPPEARRGGLGRFGISERACTLPRLYGYAR